VIDAHAHASLLHRLAVLLGVLARRRVDQRHPAVAALGELDQPLGLVVDAAHPLDLVREVGPIEAAHVEPRRGHRQLHRDVGADLGRGRRRERREPRRRQLAHRVAQAAVVGAEVVAPLADAVGLVDRQERRRGPRERPRCTPPRSPGRSPIALSVRRPRDPASRGGSEPTPLHPGPVPRRPSPPLHPSSHPPPRRFRRSCLARTELSLRAAPAPPARRLRAPPGSPGCAFVLAPGGRARGSQARSPPRGAMSPHAHVLRPG
jgi:hypothetical protein